VQPQQKKNHKGLRTIATPCGYWRRRELNLVESNGKTDTSQAGGAESGAPGVSNPITDPDLAALAEAWARLPEPIRAAIRSLLRAAGT
jgi:hypothetical protein